MQVLIINSFKYEDQEQYSCRAINPAGITSTHCEVVLKCESVGVEWKVFVHVILLFLMTTTIDGCGAGDAMV